MYVIMTDPLRKDQAMKKPLLAALLALFYCVPVAAQIAGPETVGIGKLVKLTSDVSGGVWMPLQPIDLETADMANGGLAFSSGLVKQNIVIVLLAADWENRKLLTPERIIIRVGGEPEPGPDPDPELLEGAGKLTYDVFSEAVVIKPELPLVAGMIEGVASRAAGLHDWDGKRIMSEINQGLVDMFPLGSPGQLEIKRFWQLTMQKVASDKLIDVSDKDAMIDMCNSIAKGLRAVGG